MSANITRRTFLGTSGVLGLAATAAGAAAPAPSDRITVGMIAVGSRAHELLEAIKTVKGTEIVGVCDAYRGRIERAVARTDGRARVYESPQAILDDKGIDVVVVASPDHLHKQQVIASLEAGKDVYCEKPLTYTVDEGLEIAAAVKKTGRLLQVGSQGISSQTQQKAKQFIQSGKLGQVTVIQANYNRNTASGAWIYPIPPDAAPETVDWDMFQGPAPKHPFSLERFFRWRCYQEYSGGIATDLFVHLCTTIHYLMDAKMPARVAAMGQLYRWKESRDVPDTLYGVLDYPEGFTVSLGSTFNNQLSSESSFQILGTEGSLLMGYDSFKFVPERTRENNRWIVKAWPERLEEQYNRDLRARNPKPSSSRRDSADTVEFRERGRDATELHFESFFRSVRDRTPVVEDVWTGHRAASCAHLINDSARRGQFVEWDFAADRQKA